MGPWSELAQVRLPPTRGPWSDLARVNTSPPAGPPPSSPWSVLQQVRLPPVTGPWSELGTVDTEDVDLVDSPFKYWTGSEYADLEAYRWDGEEYVKLIEPTVH